MKSKKKNFPKGKYKVIKVLERWAVSKRKNTYLVNYVFDTREEAEEAAFWKNAHDALEKLEVFQVYMELNNMVSENDPYGWRC